MRTRKVGKSSFVTYRKRSDQYEASAQRSSELRHWDAAVGNAIHAVISMADALAVWHLGMRSASQDHGGTIELFFRLSFGKKELDENARHLSRLLELKNAAEYEERSLSEKDWDAAEPHMTRFRGWAAKKLPSGR